MPFYSPEVQQRLAEVLQVKAAHEDELLRLTGVHAVSVQPKTTKGVRTPEFAIVVYVARKKAPEELAAGEMIPPVIDGVPTDVIEMAPRVVSAAPPTDTDDSHYPHVVGGAMIVSDGMTRVSAGATPSQGATVSFAKGTLGCVAINQDPAVTDLSKKAVALTNAHVLLEVARTTTHDGSGVGQPDTSSLCCKSCDHTIGHVDHDVKLIGFAPGATIPPTAIGIDAGFVTLDPGVQWSTEVIVSGEGSSITTEQIAGFHAVDGTEALFDMTKTPPVPIYAIHKRGVRTEATQGWLVSITTTVTLPYESLDKTVTKTLQLPNQLELQTQDPTKFFALQGDSGSVVLNSSRQVIGLLYGVPPDTASPNSNASACPIAEVQKQLNVLVADSATYSGVQTVPTPAAAHAFAALPAERTVLRERMEIARTELGSTEIGQLLDDTLHRHFTEIRWLVNVNKRAAAVWRRILGPAWVSEVFNCLLDRARRFPAEVEGRKLSDCIDQLSRVLDRYGSESLVRDLANVKPELRALAGRSYEEMLAVWRGPVTT
jgi:hypothetical protein